MNFIIMNYTKSEHELKLVVARLTQLYHERNEVSIMHLDTTRALVRAFIPHDERHNGELDKFVHNWMTDEANKLDATIVRVAHKKGILEAYFDECYEAYHHAIRQVNH